MRLIRLMPTSAAMLFSINASFVYIGAAIGSLASGRIVDVVGLSWLGPAAAIVVLAAVIYLRMLDRNSQNDML